MKYVFILTTVLFIESECFSQQFDLKNQKYVGSVNNRYFFFQYGVKAGTIKPCLIEYGLKKNSEFYMKNTTPWNDMTKGIPKFIGDSIEVCYKKLQSQLIITYGDSLSTFEVNPEHDFSLPTIARFPKSDTLFISANSTSPIYMFNKKTFKLYTLPLIGGNLRVKDNCLFFESLRYSDNYSDYPEDVYRVNRSDLKNPLVVLIQVEEDWYPFNANVVYAKTFPKTPELPTNESNSGFYNLVTASFSIAPENISPEKFIEIDNKTFELNFMKKGVLDIFQIKEIPSQPLTFPYKMISDQSQAPKGNIFKYYNIPLSEKTFPGTFISHELLFKANQADLQKLNKEQLRILRNTFFAFQGYKFESADLAKFFGQFEWYQKLILGDKRNASIVIWPDEVERIKHFLEIENSK